MTRWQYAIGMLVVAVVTGVLASRPQTLPGATSQPAHYSAPELRDLSARGELPAFGAGTSEVEASDFDACVAQADDLADRHGDYPTQILTERPGEYVVRVWSGSGFTSMTCTARDRLMVVIRRPFLRSDAS